MDLVLNWIVQGGLVALAAAAVLRFVPPSLATVRYGVACVAVAVVLLLPLVPIIVAAAVADAPGTPLGPAVAIPAAWLPSMMPLVGLWLVWCGVCSIRLVAAAAAVRATRRQARDCPAHVQARLRHWSRVRRTGRHAPLALSNGVGAAAVLGCGSPMIALAPALLDQLSDADLDRVVLHEWAHVQRRDDLVQFLQQVVRAACGWHPGIWWLGRQIDVEREIACDQIAVAMTGSAKQYATCLVRIAALPTHGRPLAALSVVNAAGLQGRIRRILSTPDSRSRLRSMTIGVSASVALTAFAVAAGNVQVVEPQTVSSVFDLADAAPRTPAAAAAYEAAVTEGIRQVLSGARAPAARLRSSQQSTAPSRAPQRTTIAAAPPPPLVNQPPVADHVVPARSVVAWHAVPIAAPMATTTAPAWDTAVERADAEPDAAADLSRVNGVPPWTAAADAGAAVGRGSRTASVAVAGFFSRFGKQVANSF